MPLAHFLPSGNLTHSPNASEHQLLSHTVLGAEQSKWGPHRHGIYDLPGEATTFFLILNPVVGKTAVIISPLLTQTKRTKSFDLQETPSSPPHFLLPSILTATLISLQFLRHTDTFPLQGLGTCCSLCLEHSSSIRLYGLSFPLQSFTQRLVRLSLVTLPKVQALPNIRHSYYLCHFLFSAHDFLKNSFY